MSARVCGRIQREVYLPSVSKCARESFVASRKVVELGQNKGYFAGRSTNGNEDGG